MSCITILFISKCKSDIRPHIKWAVSLVIFHMITSIFLRALCGYVWVNILTLSLRGIFSVVSEICLQMWFYRPWSWMVQVIGQKDYCHWIDAVHMCTSHKYMYAGSLSGKDKLYINSLDRKAAMDSILYSYLCERPNLPHTFDKVYQI